MFKHEDMENCNFFFVRWNLGISMWMHVFGIIVNCKASFLTFLRKVTARLYHLLPIRTVSGVLWNCGL